MKKLLFILSITFIYADQSLDNLLYIYPGMTMEEVHEKIGKPHNVRGTRIHEEVMISVHEHYLKKKGKKEKALVWSGLSGAILSGALSFGENTVINSFAGGAICVLIANLIVGGEKTGEDYWMFYEDGKLTFFCKPGDWETTAPPTIKVQWEDLND